MNKLSTIDCPHFGACSGCTLNDPYSPHVFKDVKRFYSNYNIDIGPLEAGTIIGWRIKAKLAVREEIGLFKARSHDVIPIPHCKTHHPSINKAAALIKAALNTYSVSTYNEKTHKGLLRYMQCLVDLETDKVQLVLVTQADDPSIRALSEQLFHTGHFHSIYLNIQSIATNQILGQQWILLYGPPFLEQKISGQSFPFHPGSFTQAHWTLFEKLAEQVVSWVPENAHLIEIYAGVGIMGILAEPKCASVTLVENNPFSYESFQSISTHAKYVLGDAKDAISLLPQSTCLILDPPRKGLDPTLLNAIQYHSGTIVYVSCDFNSFVRDAEDLMDAGWALKDGKGYLLFPGTDHVETIALFHKE